MPQLFKNNAKSTLSTFLAIDATTLTVVAGTGVSFPSVSAGGFFYATLVGINANGQEDSWEVVKVIARTNDTFTIERAQENTVAQLWPSGTRVENRLTAGTVANFANKTTITDDHIFKIGTTEVARFSGTGISGNGAGITNVDAATLNGFSDHTRPGISQTIPANWNFTGDLTKSGSAVLTQADEGPGNGINADQVDGYEAIQLGRLAAANIWTKIDTWSNNSVSLNFVDADNIDKAWRLSMFGGNFKIRSSNDAFSALNDRLIIEHATGNVKIGSTAPTEALDVDGTVKATAFTGNGAGITNVDAAKLGTWTASTSNTANTIVRRDASKDIAVRHVEMDHASSTRNADTVFYSSTGNAITKNTAAGMRESLDVPFYEKYVLELGYDFDPGEMITIIRVGDLVTVTTGDSVGHTTGTSAGSLQVIPVHLRPANEAHNVFSIVQLTEGLYTARVEVTLWGQVFVRHSMTSSGTAIGFSVTYAI